MSRKLHYQTPFSARLRLKLDLVLPTLLEADRKFFDRPHFANRFKEYLVTVHGVIRASVPLMKAAELECGEVRRDKLCSSLAKYFHEHSIEETDHDEWLLSDLNILGLSRQDVLSRKPLNEVAELVGAQYYWIHHLHPCSLLGYILALEGYPITKEELNEVIKRSKFPKAAFRTLLEHSSLDVHHLQELDRVLDTLPLSQNQEEWITLNAIYTIRKCSRILDML
jgi:hypothetical protein